MNQTADAVDGAQASGNTTSDVPQEANGDVDVEMSTEESSSVDTAPVAPEQEAVVQSA